MNEIEYGVLFLALYITVVYILFYLEKKEKLKEEKKKVNFQPSISIIIPAYNEEAYIERCIKSVLSANYPKEKIEIIVVDDGSTDKTYEKAKKYEKKGVKVFKIKNSGKANAINLGISKAKGEIIATLDADSYITPDAINKMLPLFCEEEEVMAVTAAVKVNNKMNFWEKLQNAEYIFTIFSRKILSFLDAVHVTPGPFSMFKKQVFEELGGFDPNNILEDQEIAMRIQSKNYKIKSSMEAEVFTEVPSTFKDLLKQRIRWHRGGLRNSIKYLELISPEYGDFGMIVMPLSFISVVMIFLLLISAIITFISKLPYEAVIGFEVQFLAIGPLHILSFLLFAMTVWWLNESRKYLKKDGLKLKDVIIYSLTYTYLITIFWLFAIYKEIKGEGPTW